MNPRKHLTDLEWDERMTEAEKEDLVGFFSDHGIFIEPRSEPLLEDVCPYCGQTACDNPHCQILQ